LSINSAAVSINSSVYEFLSLENIDRVLQPMYKNVFDQQTVMNFCMATSQTNFMYFDMKIKLAGDDQVLYEDAILNLSTPHPNLVSQSYNSNQPTRAPTKPPIISECTGVPNKVVLSYKRRRCNQSDSSQFIKRRRYLKRSKGGSKGGTKAGSSPKSSISKKSKCLDIYPLSVYSKVLISSKHGDRIYFDDNVSEDEQFELSSRKSVPLSEELKINIYSTNGRLSQSFSLKLSCPWNLHVGDAFGSIKVVTIH